MRRLVAVAAMAASLVLGACAGARSGAPVERTTLVVENRGFADMAVYVVNGAQRIRLGTATGLSKTTLTIPPRVVGTARDLQFLADPIGGSRSGVSQSIYVHPGDRVTLLISP